MIEEEINTKERILLKARELLMQYGIRSVSMDDLAGTLGMSKKTLYQHFTDKSDLVKQVINKILTYNQECCKADKVRSKDALQEVILAMQMVATMFKNMNTAILFDLQKYHPDVFSLIEKHKQQFLFGVIKENIERGKKEKLYREELDVELMARFRVEVIFMFLSSNALGEQSLPFAEIDKNLTTHFLYGLVTPKGYELLTKYLNEKAALAA